MAGRDWVWIVLLGARQESFRFTAENSLSIMDRFPYCSFGKLSRISKRMLDALPGCVDGYASMQASRCVLHRSTRSRHGARSMAGSWTPPTIAARFSSRLPRDAGSEKPNFQILCRTMETRAQNLGSVKDIQVHLRHSQADTTANEYMQVMPENVQEMVGSVYLMLAKGREAKVPFEEMPQT